VKHRTPPEVEELCGVWVRRSLEWADGRSDTTTQVTWLQGAEWFVDLRRPGIGPPAGTWVPQLEAFAGRLTRSCSATAEFTWERLIDWSKPAGPDIGRLNWDGNDLIEVGVLEPYREVWVQAERHSPDDSATASFTDGAGRSGIVLRSAGFFGFAVGRTPRTGELHLDCEIGIGVITDGSWQIRSSTRDETDGAPICLDVNDTEAKITAPPSCACLLAGTWQISEITGDSALLQTL